MIKPIGFAHEHNLFLHSVSSAGVADHMLHRWLANAFPELGMAKSRAYRDYWVAITRGEPQAKAKYKKLK